MSTSEMNDVQVAGLAAAICATAEAMGQDMNPSTAALMAEDLCAYPVDAVKGALKACRNEVRGKLVMADIQARIQLKDGRPGKDEAWAIAVMANDEFETVVMTDEIQLALTAARPVLESGDKIGARMTFINAYERFVLHAREAAKPVNWHVSIGYDANRRAIAIEKAVQMQRIPHEHGQKYLADLRIAPVTEDGRALAGLITGTVTRPSPDVSERLQGVKKSMLAVRKANADRKQQIREEAEQQFAERRAELMRQVEQLQSQGATHG
ncbi:hypothetical protein [Pseudomonas sp. BTN1]|uniref:hypothetical protein n=1 Tax=Pseudomonas sp. BTN1 TaxID=1750647 RepID=UPI000939B8A6|nr:hypothetical protein [Pseudomonas sp. BTN1]OKO47371.1 hypothetical protein BMH52_15705 [Pseudomonas sp. BTN1]